MPHITQRGRYQKAVLWPIIGLDEFGEPRLGPPEEIMVRWTWKRRESVDSTGRPIAIDAEVVPNKEILLGSYLWLGALADWDDGLESDVMIAETYGEITTTKGRGQFRTLGLQWAQEDLPGGTRSVDEGPTEEEVRRASAGRPRKGKVRREPEQRRGTHRPHRTQRRDEEG